MRRLLLILLACLAFVPMLPMPAQASHGRAESQVARCVACPMQRGHDAGPADHGCFGCSIETEPVAAIAPRLALRAAAPAAPGTAEAFEHRPGFDPPPPRARG